MAFTGMNSRYQNHRIPLPSRPECAFLHCRGILRPARILSYWEAEIYRIVGTLGVRMKQTSRITLACTLLVVLAWAQAPSKFRPGFNLFSKEQDVQVGQESATQVRKQMTMLKDPFLNQYVSSIGKRLANAQEAKDSGFPFTFEVVADPSINAFALPGGPMFINSGLLKACDNEAQLAGVMGHEMSHVILRHGTHEASKANLIQLPVLLAGSLIGDETITGKLARLGLGLGANSFLLKFSRDAESEADALGSHLMSEAGYDPVEMARFFQKLAAGPHPPQLLSDHPNPGNRERAIRAEMQTLPAR